MSTHTLLEWNDFGDMWICRECERWGSPVPGDRPEDYPCTALKEASMNDLTDEELDQLETEDEFLARYDLSKYPAQALTVDLAIFTIRNDRLAILMVKRGGHPEKGKWALPGGFVNVTEDLDTAAARELQEETNITTFSVDSMLRRAEENKAPVAVVPTSFHAALRSELRARGIREVSSLDEASATEQTVLFTDENLDEVVQTARSKNCLVVTTLPHEQASDSGDFFMEQLKTYAKPGRDPRGYIVSCAYVALVPKAQNPTAGDDAAEARFFAVDDVLNDFDLAFDHEQIIQDGLARVRAKLEYSPIGAKFLDDDEFTLPELQHVYEIVWGVKFKHPSNFRRKVQSAGGFLVPVGSRRTSSLEGGRASDLYRLGEASVIYPPLRQPPTA